MILSDFKNAITYLFPKAVYTVDYTAALDVNKSATLLLWNPTLGEAPTADQITAALSAYNLANVKAPQIATIEAAYETARYGTPVSLTVGSNTLSFPTDTATQTNITGYLVAFNATNAPATMPLQDASGAVQMLTYAQLQTLALTIANNSMTVWQKMAGLIAQINAATTIAAVQAVVWS